MKNEISIAFQTDKSAAEYIELAQLVNQYNFDVLSVYCDLPYHSPYAALLLMAPHLRTARLGVAANAHSRIHPLDIASQTALLYELAKGGVYVGVARGAWLAEHGIAERKPAIKAVKEAIEVIRYMLEGQSGGYAGEIYQLAAHVRVPYPVPIHRVPVLIGTWGKQLAALAGEIADEVKIGGSANPDMVPLMQAYIKQGELVSNRQPGTVGVVVGAVSVLDEDRQMARALARREVALYLPIVAPLDPTLKVDMELIDRLNVAVQQNRIHEAASMISDELLDKFALSGNAQDVIRQTESLFERGAKRVEFGTPHGLNSKIGIQILGQQVLPALRHYQG